MISIIKAQIITKNIKITVQNITHWSQWDIAADFKVLYLNIDSIFILPKVQPPLKLLILDPDFLYIRHQ